MKTLRTATCQFSVEPSIAHNRGEVLRQIAEAAEQGAQVAHFSECALTGYAGVDIPDTNAINWTELVEATREIQAAAKKHQLWVLLGSTHQLSAGRKPHNSVYIINAQGKIVDRYDKRFCTGQGSKGKTGTTLDLAHYTPGNRFAVFKIKGITCSTLICYDYRFPELYRELKKQEVQIVFQSFHNARRTVVANQKYNIWKTIVPATMACRAAENHFWISANNSATRPSCWPAFAVRPDGAVVGKLKLHQPGVLITDMELDPEIFDAPGLWRDSAMSGRLHSGTLVDDPRSSDVTCL